MPQSVTLPLRNKKRTRTYPKKGVKHIPLTLAIASVIEVKALWTRMDINFAPKWTYTRIELRFPGNCHVCEGYNFSCIFQEACCLINYKHLNGDDIGINCLLICVRSSLHLIDAPAWVWFVPLNWLIHLDSILAFAKPLPLTFDVGRDGKQRELDQSQCPWAPRLHNRAKCAKSWGEIRLNGMEWWVVEPSVMHVGLASAASPA